MLQSLQNLYEDFITHVVTQAWFYPALGALGVLVLLLLIASLFRGSKGLRVYRDESGSASVTQSALKDLVHLACSTVDTATKPKIKVKPRRGRLDLTIKVKLYQGQRLNELRDRMRRSVIRTFEEDHGIRLGDINVLIIGFKKGGSYGPVNEPEPEEDPTMEDEDIKPITDPVVKFDSEKKPESHKHSGPDIGVVSALGGGIATDHMSSTNSPEFAATDEMEPEVNSEPKPEKKKSLFSWGKKSEDTNSDESSDSESDEPASEAPESEKK